MKRNKQPTTTGHTMTDLLAKQEQKLSKALDGMSGTFHLSGQHASAGPFRVNRLASYVDSRLVPQVVIQSQLEDGRWTDYMRHDAAYFLARYMGRVSLCVCDYDLAVGCPANSDRIYGNDGSTGPCESK